MSSAITIKQIGDFVWFSPQSTKPSYGSVVKALKSHIRYITSKAKAVVGNAGAILRKAEEELARRKNSRVALKFYMAVPNDWSEEKAINVVKSFVKEQLNIPEENLLLAFHDQAGNKHIHIIIFPRTAENKKLRINRVDLQNFHRAWEDLLVREGYQIFKLPEEVSAKKIPIWIVKKKPELYESYIKAIAEYKQALLSSENEFSEDTGGEPDGSPVSSKGEEDMKFRETQLREIKLQVNALGFEPSSKVAVVCTAPGKPPIQRIVRTEKLLDESFLSFLRKLNAQGYNIYLSINELKENAKDRKKESFKESQRHIYLDIDGDKLGVNGYKLLAQILKELDLPQPTLVLRTSKNNIQVVWTTDEELSNEVIEAINSFLAEKYNLDKATDISRVFRLAGFFNRKPNKGDFVYVDVRNSSLKPISASAFLNLIAQAYEAYSEGVVENLKSEETEDKLRKSKPKHYHTRADYVVMFVETFLKKEGVDEEDLEWLKEELDIDYLIRKAEEKSFSEFEQALLYRYVRFLSEVLDKEGLLEERLQEMYNSVYESFKETLKELRPEKLEKSPNYPIYSVNKAFEKVLDDLEKPPHYFHLYLKPLKPSQEKELRGREPPTPEL